MIVIRPLQLIVIPTTAASCLATYVFTSLRAYDGPYQTEIQVGCMLLSVILVPWSIFGMKRVRTITIDGDMVIIREGAILRASSESTYQRTELSIRPSKIKGRYGYEISGTQILNNGEVVHELHGWAVGWLPSRIAALQDALNHSHLT